MSRIIVHRFHFLAYGVASFLLFLAFSPPACALGPENLLLIVNKNVPDGLKLADAYAQARHVPEGRIVELDLPAGDELTFEQYERDVALPVARFIREKELEKTVTCLVTFYGVPLRIADHKLTAEESREIAELKKRNDQLTREVEPAIAALEQLAKDVNPAFRPLEIERDEADPLARRGQVAAQAIALQIARTTDPNKRAELTRRFIEVQKQILAAGALAESAPAENHVAATSQADDAPTTLPAATQPTTAETIHLLSERRIDPAVRRELLGLARQQEGVFGELRMIAGELAYLSPEASEAALDNELALLRWSFYDRSRWQFNPMCYRYSDFHAPAVLMVMRLDAPTPKLVHEIIGESIKVEDKGLSGTFAIDARGLPSTKPGGAVDPYGIFDQSLRDLAERVKTHTKLPLHLDNKPALLPPNSVSDVALYCGWYSPGQYVPSVKLVSAGAVAWHVASYEMTSLHNENGGWCRGLLTAGAAATLGPVSEPFLHAFPNPEDFFSLLLTGKLSLAEVYWRTTPMVSWKMAAIGDPLYTPFKANPQLTVDDLPARLKPIFSDAMPHTP